MLVTSSPVAISSVAFIVTGSDDKVVCIAIFVIEAFGAFFSDEVVVVAAGVGVVVVVVG